MNATLSSKGQIVLPAAVRRQLQLAKGEQLAIDVRGDSLVLRRVVERRRYRTERHPTSGLPVMVAVRPPKRRVSATEIARLQAELL